MKFYHIKIGTVTRRGNFQSLKEFVVKSELELTNVRSIFQERYDGLSVVISEIEEIKEVKSNKAKQIKRLKVEIRLSEEQSQKYAGLIRKRNKADEVVREFEHQIVKEYKTNREYLDDYRFNHPEATHCNYILVDFYPKDLIRKNETVVSEKEIDDSLPF